MDLGIATAEASVVQAALARCYLERACCYEKGGDLEEALRACLSAIDIVPSLAEAHNYRGLLLERLGLRLEALDCYRKALDLKPTFPEAAHNLARLEERQARSRPA